MFIIYSILLLSIFSVHLRPPSDQDFTRRDCFESFSFPKEFLELSSFLPVSPNYIYVIFNFDIYPKSFDFQPINIRKEYHFKRSIKPCTSSLFFTAKGISFVELNIAFQIYLYRSSRLLADIFYTFEHDFYPGVYQLRDKTSNFAVALEILKIGKYHIKNSTNILYEARSYLKKLSVNNGSLCVLNKNNDAFVIKPNYIGEIPNGLITYIIVEYIHNNLNTESFLYTTFECSNNEENYEDTLVFIDENIHVQIIYFSAVYLEFNNDDTMEVEISFSLSNISRIDVRQSQNLTNNNKKLFAVEEIKTIITCDDGTHRMLFRSRGGTTYSAIEMKDEEVAPDVFQRKRVVHSPLVPCAK